MANDKGPLDDNKPIPPRRDSFSDIPHVREGTRPDFSTPPPRKQLPKDLQATLNDEQKLWSLFYEGKTEDSTETNFRYAAYASRVRTIMLSAHRYVAYTSDIGESFRPIAHPYLVRGAYAVSWLYLTGDVAHEGYKAYVRNQRVLNPEAFTEKDAKSGEEQQSKVASAIHKIGEGLGVTPGPANPVSGDGHVAVSPRVSAIEDYRAVMAQRAVFQAVASMGLPAFTIHSVVRYSGRALKNAKNKTLRTWGPIGLGLAVVPFLPYIFDEPVEHATEWIFYNAFKAIGGEKAVEGRAPTGNHHRHGSATKEKEL